jgi:hypothetical protein
METIKFPSEEIIEKKRIDFNEANKFEVKCEKCQYWVKVKINEFGWAPCANKLNISINEYHSTEYETLTSQDFGCNQFKRRLN